MERSICRKFSLSKVETFVFFAAMLMAITLEGACVYSLATAHAPRVGIEPTNLVGQWTAATLPECWLIGAFFVLLYRLSAILLPLRSWAKPEVHSNRSAFLRLWGWTVVLGVLQAGTLYLDRFTTGLQ